MPDLITDVLDALAVLAIAAGVGAGSALWLGWWGLAVGGVVLLAGSLVIDALNRPGRRAAE